MYVGKRIKDRRIELGFSVDEVAAKLGKNRATIYRYESNDIENFPITVLEPLAIVLQTTPAYLMGWVDDPNGYPPEGAKIKDGDNAKIIALDGSNAYDVSKLTKKAQTDIDDILSKIDAEKFVPTHRIPILGRVAAGLPMYAEENIEGYTFAVLPPGGEYFGLRVKGDSMSAARIFDGDIIVVRKQEIVENGEIAVVIVNGDDATVKKFYREGNIVTLSPCSFNPVHQTQIYDTGKIEVRVVGKVVLNQIKYD